MGVNFVSYPVGKLLKFNLSETSHVIDILPNIKPLLQ